MSVERVKSSTNNPNLLATKKHLQVLNNSIVLTLQKIILLKEFAQEVLANSQQTRLNI